MRGGATPHCDPDRPQAAHASAWRASTRGWIPRQPDQRQTARRGLLLPPTSATSATSQQKRNTERFSRLGRQGKARQVHPAHAAPASHSVPALPCPALPRNSLAPPWRTRTWAAWAAQAPRSRSGGGAWACSGAQGVRCSKGQQQTSSRCWAGCGLRRQTPQRWWWGTYLPPRHCRCRLGVEEGAAGDALLQFLVHEHEVQGGGGHSLGKV